MSNLERTEAALPDVLRIRGPPTCMTTKAYKKRKALLLPQLREKCDPPPRIMRPGTMPCTSGAENLRKQLDASGGRLVRGFKLYRMLLDPEHWPHSAWLAVAHAVVEVVSPQGTAVYVDPSANDGSDPTAEYIFVPSSRLHRELSSEEWLSGRWILGSVVGGDARFCQAYIIHKKALGRWQSVVGVTPEELVAKQHVFVRMMPHFLEWHKERELSTPPEVQADMMGAAAFPVGTEVDESDLLHMYSAISDNTESYVDGLLGLKIESKCREKLWLGELTVEEVKTVFFAHFDAQATIVRCKRKEFIVKQLEQCGFNSVYS